MKSIASSFNKSARSLFILFALAACAGGIQTSSETSKGVELKNYKTYAWAKPGEDDTRKNKKLFTGLILERADAELKKKGFKLDAENPQAIFSFDTRLEERVDYTQNAYVPVGPGYGGPGYYGYYTAPTSGGQFVAHETEHGMLFIEMYDTKSQKLLWRGSAQKQITAKSDVEADVKKAVKDIFMRLPVKHKE